MVVVCMTFFSAGREREIERELVWCHQGQGESRGKRIIVAGAGVGVRVMSGRRPTRGEGGRITMMPDNRNKQQPPPRGRPSFLRPPARPPDVYNIVCTNERNGLTPRFMVLEARDTRRHSDDIISGNVLASFVDVIGGGGGGGGISDDGGKEEEESAASPPPSAIVRGDAPSSSRRRRKPEAETANGANADDDDDDDEGGIIIFGGIIVVRRPWQ